MFKEFIVNCCLSYFISKCGQSSSIIYCGLDPYFDWNHLCKDKNADYFTSLGKFQHINVYSIYSVYSNKGTTIRIIHCKPTSSFDREGFKLSVTIFHNNGSVSLFYPSSNVRDGSDFKFCI